MKERMRIMVGLFFTMLKIGLFTFGGGYAMIALLENELVQKKAWMDKDSFLDMVAISESTPGSIAVNAATYIGYRMAGVGGSVAATVGVCLPSFVIIYALSLFLDAFLAVPYVAYAFRGIQVCVIYLILSAGIKMLKGIRKTPFSIVILSAVFLCMLTLSLLAVSFSTVLYIVICGVLGISLYLLQTIRGKGERGS